MLVYHSPHLFTPAPFGSSRHDLLRVAPRPVPSRHVLTSRHAVALRDARVRVTRRDKTPALPTGRGEVSWSRRSHT